MLKAPRILGATPIPVVTNMELTSSWTRAQNGEGQTFRNDYSRFLYPGQTLKARICATWTDNCSNPNGSHFTLKYVLVNNAPGNVTPSSTDVFFAPGFEQTWSGRSLYHAGCSEPQSAAPLFKHCGGSWSGTCQLMIKRTGGDSCPVVITAASMEWLAE